MTKKTFNSAVLLLIAFSGCSPSGALKYGFLPGSDYQFFSPTKHIDLEGRRFNFVFSDKRSEVAQARCSDVEPDKDSELEGALGFQYFTRYFKAMADSCHGKVDSTSADTIRVDLQVLRPKFSGFIKVTVHGIVQFAVRSADTLRIYCSDMKDGDPDSPFGTSSVATRKSAMRGMIGASCRRALQNYFEDVYASFDKKGSTP